jgi:hypothetical protein
VQVVGNRCESLQVGQLPAGDALVTTGLAIVTANRAQRALDVQHYKGAVVAHNAARAYSSWIQHPNAPIDGLNLQT